MTKDFLKDVKPEYDVIVIGSGLAGLTAANVLGKCGHRVLLLEHHYTLGGMAQWFKRKGGHIFDISLHGFPAGMLKSCRKYWNRTIAESIVQLKGVRFDNPQFSFTTTFDQVDFTNKLVNYFNVPGETVDKFFAAVRDMEYYDDQAMTTRELFEQYFPGRHDVQRLLMEPITYANGSNMDDPAITYGIVFSNFMSKGVFIFQGGSDKLITEMRAEMERNNVDVRTNCRVENILIKNGRAAGVRVNGRDIRANAVLSNANLKNTLFHLVGEENLPPDYANAGRAVRLANSSCQVYIGIRDGETIDYVGDLIFTSSHPRFDYEAMCAREVSSRTFSYYYNDIRPGRNRFAIVSSTNANYRDWADLSEQDYLAAKQHLIDDTLNCLEKYSPGVREKIDWVEAGTPKTFERYTFHAMGATFGTKFEGLKVSSDLPDVIPGLYHAGSVGIIMSGWLGAINYGVIVSNKIDQQLLKTKLQATGQASA